jgi:hypothetical protein
MVSQQVSMQDREKLMQIISDPASREAFRNNPKPAAVDAGVMEGPALDRLVEVLASMSDEELHVIARVNAMMVEMGLTEEGSMFLGRAV